MVTAWFQAVPPSADVFGWCTWDAFYSRVSAAGVLQGVASLAAGGAPPEGPAYADAESAALALLAVAPVGVTRYTTEMLVLG